MADEGAPGHVGAGSEIVDGDRLGQVAEHPVAEGGEFVAARLGAELVNVLRLAAGSPGRRHQRPRSCVSGGGTVVDADEVQAQVDAGGHAGRREDVAVVDVYPVRLDVDARVLPAEPVRYLPVGSRGSSVEEA